MNQIVEEFIKNHLDLIDLDDWMAVFLSAYDELTNIKTAILINTLAEAEIDIKKIKEGRDSALRFIIIHQMEDLPSDSIWTKEAFTELLNNFLGLSYREICNFIYNESAEWPDCIEIIDYDFDNTGKFDISVM